MRLLIVEDSERLRGALIDGLRAAGYAVDAVGNGREGLIYARTTEYDAILLDVLLPELDGISLLKQFRGAQGATPVMILSARDRVAQRVEGLRAGADDYLVKPFDFSELLARIEALARRSRGVARNTVRIGGVSLDLAAKRFTTPSGGIATTPREYALLEYLFLNAGRAVSRNELEEHIYPADRQVWSNAVDSAVAALRRKLADAGVEGIIQTRRGHGYMVTAEDPARGAP